MVDSKKISNPLDDFFQAVIDELRKRLTPEEFSKLLEKCDLHSENGNTRTDTKSTSAIPAK